MLLLCSLLLLLCVVADYFQIVIKSKNQNQKRIVNFLNHQVEKSGNETRLNCLLTST